MSQSIQSVSNSVRHEPVQTTAKVDGEAVVVPRIVVEGSRPGPTLTVTAAQHGRELNGIEAVRRLLRRVEHEPIAGTLQLFPVVNPPAVQAVRQTLPGNSQNPNRVWPGSPTGTNTERLLAAVAPHIIASDYLVDLHGWSDWTVDVVLTGSATEPRILELAEVFGLGFIFCNAGGFQPGNLKTFAWEHDVVPIGIELTPQWRLREAAVEAGCRGLLNVMRHVGMLPGKPDVPALQWRYQTDTPHEDLLAEGDGLFVQAHTVGAAVSAGEVLGRLYALDTLELIQEVQAPIDGVLINLGPCHQGVECNRVPAGAMLAQVWQAEQIRRP